jgi:hypothetical protein
MPDKLEDLTGWVEYTAEQINLEAMLLARAPEPGPVTEVSEEKEHGDD